jgi:hypothetical protein
MRRDAHGADPTVVKLGAGDLQAVLDPWHGAELAELSVSGRQVLSRTPWKRRPAVQAADESDWLGAWAGGWQILFPSAGPAGMADGRWHPFHGASSQAPWTLRTVGPTTATLCWADDGWHVERRVVLSDNAVRVETEAANATTSARAAVAVEHLTFGGDLLGATPARLRSGPCSLQVLNEEGAPRGKSQQWPIAADGEDWSFVPAAGPASRFGALIGLADTSVSIRLADIELRMRWDPSLPFLWYWLELDATSQAPWNSSTRVLGLEPASFPHALGLTRARQDGSARVIGPGESWSWFVEITAVGPAGPVSEEAAS